MFLGKLGLSDEVIVGTPKGIETTRSFRRMTEDRQWNPETLRMFVGVPWNPRGITTDAPGGIRKRYIAGALVRTHGATDGCAACHGDAQVHVPRCRNRFEDIFDREKLPGQPREVVQQDEPGRAAEDILPGDQRVQMEQQPQQQQQHRNNNNRNNNNRNNNMHQSRNPVHSPPVRVTKSRCKSAPRLDV